MLPFSLGIFVFPAENLTSGRAKALGQSAGLDRIGMPDHTSHSPALPSTTGHFHAKSSHCSGNLLNRRRKIKEPLDGMGARSQVWFRVDADVERPCGCSRMLMSVHGSHDIIRFVQNIAAWETLPHLFLQLVPETSISLTGRQTIITFPSEIVTVGSKHYRVDTEPSL